MPGLPSLEAIPPAPLPTLQASPGGGDAVFQELQSEQVHRAALESGEVEVERY